MASRRIGHLDKQEHLNEKSDTSLIHLMNEVIGY